VKKSFLKTKTVHGLKTGNHSNPNVLRAARASGGSCMVEGGSSRPPMSKPRMMRADGGGVQISERSKEDIKRLESENAPRAARTAGALAAGTTLGVMAAKGLAKLGGGKARLADKATFGGLGMVGGANADRETSDKLVSTDKEIDRLKRGMAEPGKEDRKNGGGIFPRFKPKSKDKDDC